MTWQDWAVGVIVLLCVAVVARRVVCFFRSARDNNNPCANCATGCELKRMRDKMKKKSEKS